LAVASELSPARVGVGQGRGCFEILPVGGTVCSVNLLLVYYIVPTPRVCVDVSGVVGCGSKFFFSSTVRVHSVHSPAGVYVAR
jgi:hypothetical protein